MVNFSGIETAKTSKAGNYIKPGNYVMQIIVVKQGTTRKGEEFVVLEMTVLHIFDGEHSQGDPVAHMLMSSNDSFLGNWKAIIMGITGCEESEVTQTACETVLGEEQPFAKLIVKVNAFNIKTQAGKDFTVVEYHGQVEASDLTEEAKALLV